MDLVSGISIENAAPLAVGQVAPKRRKKHHKPVEDCQNCGAKLAGEFCHECGQQGHVHRSVLHVIEEVFHGITHFDSRTWRSLPMLAFRPGTLTRNYVMGKRARYVPPFAMFLFSIFAMFLAFAFSGGPGFVSKVEFENATAVESATDKARDAKLEFDGAARELTLAREDLARERRLPEPDNADIAAAEREVGRTEGQLARARTVLDAANAALTAANASPKMPAAKSTPAPRAEVGNTVTFNGKTDPKEALAAIQVEKARAEKTGDAAEIAALSVAEAAAKAGVRATSEPANKNAIPAQSEEAGFMAQVKESMRNGEFTVNTPWPSLNEKIKKKFKNPDLFIYKMQNTVYKFSFLLVPLSLPFLWLMLFWKRGVTLFDHAVFALYSLSFVSFLFLFISVAAHWFEVGPMFGAASIILPIHIFFQFKGAYALKWFSAFWRTVLFCGGFAWIIVSMFTLSIVVLGATG